MVKHLTLAALLLLTGLWPRTAGGNEAPRRKPPTDPCSRNVFLAVEDFDLVGLTWLRAYANYPKDITGLAPSEYPAVVQQFQQWIEDVINPELAPDPAYVAKHLLLVPAAVFLRRTGINEDTAFLRYRIGERDYLIVQSGGRIDARLIFFSVEPEGDMPRPFDLRLLTKPAKPARPRGVVWLDFGRTACAYVDKWQFRGKQQPVLSAASTPAHWFSMAALEEPANQPPRPTPATAEPAAPELHPDFLIRVDLAEFPQDKREQLQKAYSELLKEIRDTEREAERLPDAQHLDKLRLQAHKDLLELKLQRLVDHIRKGGKILRERRRAATETTPAD